MCGIGGFWNLRADQTESALLSTATRMTAALAARGPDGEGTWIDAANGVALGHRRLSILDLSAAGRQPMVSACGRFVLIFNGEIYNFRQLRARLESKGHVFRGHSDSEVLLEGIAAWGLGETLERSVGMFAAAVWDTQRRSLTLFRDRLGIKPLYYVASARLVLFGSELKALRAHPDCPRSIDRHALASFMAHNYVPAPQSIYEGVRKLPPGTLMEVRADGGTDGPVPYWSFAEVVQSGKAKPFSGTGSEAADRLEELLCDAVRLRLESDVPLGAFLSGGIDSSLTTAIMQRESAGPVKTFTIGFEESGYDEAPHAARIAAHLGTEHVEQYVRPEQAREVIPRLPTIYDEPFADSSQIPTFLVSQLARSQVTVCLSGDGGDELFGGYQRYRTIPGWWDRLQGYPSWFRYAAAGGLAAAGTVLPHGPMRERLMMRQRAAGSREFLPFYDWMNTHWRFPADTVLRSGRSACPDVLGSSWIRKLPRLEQMMALDTLTYLPDDILTKVDRASMAHGLEARVPLLDHRIVEFAWTLPPELKTGSERDKLPLRDVLSRYVPAKLFERPKMGFGVPIDAWLRGPLRDWAEALLAPERLEREGFFRTPEIRRKWQEHLEGRVDWHYLLWDVLMFQAWLETQ